MSRAARTPRPRLLAVIAVAAGLAGVLAACSGRTSTRDDDTSPFEMPLRPADNVAHASVSRAIFSLHPVGTAPFAGPMLPLSSPSGTYLAVPQGAAVPWPAVLAETAAVPDPLSRIRVYALKPGGLVTLAWSNDLPRGLVLGRSCDDAGFLVEAPQADGSRWIGKVAWTDGRVDWLVRTRDLNAHAALGPAAQLVYTARAADGGPGDIILHAAGNVDPVRIAAPPDATFFAPWFEGDRIAALLISSAGIELVELSLAPGTLGAIGARRVLVPGQTSAGLAFQIIASQQLSVGVRMPEGSAVFHPGLQGMAALDESGGDGPILRGSLAAVPTSKYPGSGWLITTPEGLVYRSSEAIASGRPERVRISDVPYLPRLTTQSGRILLLGPNSATGVGGLQILMLDTAPTPVAGSRDPETGSVR